MGQNVNFTHLNRSLWQKITSSRLPWACTQYGSHYDGTAPDGSYAYSEFIDSDIANPANQIALNNDFWTTNRFVGSTSRNSTSSRT